MSQASRARSNCGPTTSAEENPTLNSAAYVAASLGVRRLPCPPTMIGGPSGAIGLGRAGESVTV